MAAVRHPATRYHPAMRTIDGMSVAITGASAGIGEALARQLHQRGAKLVLGARRLDKLQALIQELGGGHQAIALDVGDPESCRRFIAEATVGGARLDTLVCNAGIGLARTVADTSEADWEELLRVNLYGTISCLRPAVPLMRAQALRDGWRGQVVIVSSALARRGAADGGPYSATKAAQLSLAEAMRVEERPHAIAVTSIHPISTTTEFFAEAARRSGKPFNPRSPLLQTPAHVAACIVRAIAKPRPEVWPSFASRYLMAIDGVWPSLWDWHYGRHRR